MTIAHYTFRDVIFFSKKHRIIVKDAEGTEAGAIVKTWQGKENYKKLRKGTFYAFVSPDNELQMSLTVKRGVDGYTYEISDDVHGQIFECKDVKWLIYLYFHVKGTIEGERFEAHEDWNGDCVLKTSKKKFANIHFDELTFDVKIGIIDKVHPTFMSPAFLTMVYCVFRLYSMESKAVEEIFDFLNG